MTYNFKVGQKVRMVKNCPASNYGAEFNIVRLEGDKAYFNDDDEFNYKSCSTLMPVYGENHRLTPHGDDTITGINPGIGDVFINKSWDGIHYTVKNSGLIFDQYGNSVESRYLLGGKWEHVGNWMIVSRADNSQEPKDDIEDYNVTYHMGIPYHWEKIPEPEPVIKQVDIRVRLTNDSIVYRSGKLNATMTGEKMDGKPIGDWIIRCDI